MNVLSLFDGKSSGFTACELAGIEVDTYYSAEIDKYAIQVSDAIHPNQARLGSVTEWRDWDIDWSSIDMIFGGFPCQAWSVAGKQLGDKDERGMLFWTMLDIMKHVRHHNPKADFLIENVKMKKEFEEYITYHMKNAVGDVHKILINSALVSAQNRNRYYWTSFLVTQPEDRGIFLSDIHDRNAVKYTCSDHIQKRIGKHNLEDGGARVCFTKPIQSAIKAETILARDYKGFANRQYSVCFIENKKVRRLSPKEYFRLQTVPEHYIDKILDCGVSNTQLYKIAGNGWTDEVIAHILKCMEN